MTLIAESAKVKDFRDNASFVHSFTVGEASRLALQERAFASMAWRSSIAEPRSFAPWSLFSAPGQPVVQPLHVHNRMQLPIAAAAIPYVELRQHGYAVAHGLDVKARQFQLRSAGEAWVKNLYEVEPADLAELLLLLGRRLGSSGRGGPRPSVEHRPPARESDSTASSQSD